MNKGNKVKERDAKMVTVGVFYDGNFFFHVSNYYYRAHERRQRLSVHGLHSFIKKQVADLEGVDEKYVPIVDAHYFRGRLSATEAKERDALFNERSFDQVLIRERVITHYLPLSAGGEKGVDVWLALEAFELAMFKKFDVLVLIAGDGDFIPLVKKLNSIGTRVMVLGWDFKLQDQNHIMRETVTSASLMEEASYPMYMHEIIDAPEAKDKDMVEELFIAKREVDFTDIPENTSVDGTGVVKYINKALKDGCGYGFIARMNEQEDLYFYCTDLEGIDFDGLKIGDAVEFRVGSNDRGVCAKKVKLITT